MRFNWILLAGLIFTAPPASAQDAPSADDTPIYLDEQGEEVFGLGYLPSAPEETSEPLLVGQPSAGFKVDAALAPLNQNALLKGAVPSGVGLETLRGLSARVPLLKSVRERVGAPGTPASSF